MPSKPRQPSWINYGAENEEVRKATAQAVFLLGIKGTDVSDEVRDSLGSIPDKFPDTTLLLLRDEANEAFCKTPVRLTLTATDSLTANLGITYGTDVSGPVTDDDLPTIDAHNRIRFWWDLSRALEQPPRYIRLCPVCGSYFFPQRSLGRYCTELCRADANK